MNKLSLASSDPAIITLWYQICKEQENDLETWISELRAAGFSAAHPDDGWVNRKTNEIHFVYPHFYDEVKVGSLVMLGQPFNKKEARAVRIVGKRVSMSRLPWWQFEEVTTMKPYTVTGPFGRCAVEEMRLTDQFRLTCRTTDCNTSRIFYFREEAIALARALAGIDENPLPRALLLELMAK